MTWLAAEGEEVRSAAVRLSSPVAERVRASLGTPTVGKLSASLPKDVERKRPINAGKVLWCPLCDWNATDSMTTRQRMGLHLADEHYSEIAFPPGTEPDDLEPA